jgi:TMEM199 family protein
MVLLVTTQTILSALEALPPAVRDDLDLRHTPALNAPISHSQLIALARRFSQIGGDSDGNDDGHHFGSQQNEDNYQDEDSHQQKGQEDEDLNEPKANAAVYNLNTLLRGTKVYISPQPPKPDPVCRSPLKYRPSPSRWTRY